MVGVKEGGEIGENKKAHKLQNTQKTRKLKNKNKEQ